MSDHRKGLGWGLANNFSSRNITILSAISLGCLITLVRMSWAAEFGKNLSRRPANTVRNRTSLVVTHAIHKITRFHPFCIAFKHFKYSTVHPDHDKWIKVKKLQKFAADSGWSQSGALLLLSSPPPYMTRTLLNSLADATAT